jgi:hypothetical protein
VLCLEGQLDTELKDGRKFTLRPDVSYQVLTRLRRIVPRQRPVQSSSLWIESCESLSLNPRENSPHCHPEME